MPEGNTVHLAARHLDRALRDQRVTRSDFRVPKLATLDIAGSTISSVVARGKHILIRLDDGRTIHTHFKMDGEWHLYRSGERWRAPAFQARVVIETASWVAVGFRLPVIDVIDTDREDEVIGHLGPDVLGKDWDGAAVLDRLLADTDRAIGAALLDQRVIAGLGNVFRCELCFLIGADPITTVGEWLSQPSGRDPARAIDLARRLVEANRDIPGQISTGDARGGAAHWVYGRAGRPCRRCGSTILRRDAERDPSRRVTYWCPTCQPARDRATPSRSVTGSDGRRPRS